MKRRLLVLGAIALVASACGGGDDDDAESTSGDEAAPTAEAASDTSDPDTATDTGEATAVVDGDETETSSESPPLETTAPNTAAASEVTAPPSTEAPATTNQPVATTAPESNPSETADPATAFDWFAIVEQLTVLQDQVSRNPDPTIADALCLPDTPCHETTSQTVAALISDGLRTEGGAPLIVDEVEYLATIDDAPIESANGVLLLVTQTFPSAEPAVLVDANGQVVATPPTEAGSEPGDQIVRRWILGRVDVGGTWKISFIEDTNA